MPSVLVDDPFSLDQSVLMDAYPSHQHMHHHHQLHMMQQSSSSPLYESAAAAQGSASPWASLYMPSNSNLTAELSSHRTYSHHPVGMNQSLGLNLLVNRQIQEELLAQNSESISGATAAMDVEKLMGNLSIQMDHHLCDSPRGSPGSPNTYVGSPTSHDFAALHKFLPSNNEDSWSSDDVYSSDEFRMFEFKVRRCMRGRSHDWTECPFAHPGEKARRRDPRRFHYSGTACPDFRKGNCKQGDACEYAHGVFECWLHPARYRTQPCKDGRNCRRRVCFFAHTPEQLRLLPAAQAATGSSSSSSPKKQSMSNSQLVHKSCLSGSSAGSGSGSFGYEGMDSGGYGGSPLGKMQYHATPSHITSPTSTLIGLSQSPPPLSPPLSPPVSPPMSPSSPKSWHHSLSVAAARGSLLQSVSQGHAGSNLSASLNQNLTQNQHSMAAAAAAAIAVAGSSPRRQQIHLDVLGGSTAGSYASTVGSYGSGAGSYVSMDRRLQNAHSAPSSPVGSSKNMNDLVAALQQFELQGAPPLWLQAQMAQLAQSSCSLNSNTAAQYSSGPSPLRHSSMPVTPNKARWDIGEMWEMDVSEEEPVARVESGRDLRAKIYGKLNRENLVDGSSNSDSPDLGWVNELVKE